MKIYKFPRLGVIAYAATAAMSSTLIALPPSEPPSIWSGPEDDDFFESGNWTPSTAPAESEHLAFDKNNGSPASVIARILLDGQAASVGVVNGSTTTLHVASGKTLTLANNSFLYATAGSTLFLTGDAGSHISGSTIETWGSTSINTKLTLSGGTDTQGPRNGQYAIVVGNGGSMTLNSGADVTVQSPSHTAVVRVGEAHADSTEAAILTIEHGSNLTIGSASQVAAFQVGDWGTTGIVNQNGGDVSIFGSFNVGNQGGTGIYNLSGGSLTLSGGLYSIGRSTTATPGHGVMNISGDDTLLLVEQGNFILGSRDAGTAGRSQGVVNQEGGTVRIASNTTGNTNLFLGGHGDSVYNLKGGVLEVGGNQLQGIYQGSTGTYQFNLGGGLLRAFGSRLTTSVDANLLERSVSGIDTQDVGVTWSGAITQDGVGGALGKLGLAKLIFDGNVTREIGAFFALQGETEQIRGTTRSAEFVVASGLDTNASFTLTGGDLIIGGPPPLDAPGATASLRVGDFGGTGVFNQEGGSVVVNDVGALNIGNQGGTGTYNLNAGTVRLLGGNNVIGRSAAGNPASHGFLNINGGLFEVGDNSALIVGNNMSGGANGTAEIRQSGGVLRIDATSNLYLSGLTGDGRYDLDGGTLEIGGSSFHARYNNQTTNYQFNLGGGTVKVIGSDLVSKVDATLVGGTKSTFDTNGLNATFGSISGEGDFDKIGSGILRLTGNTLWSENTTSIHGEIHVGTAGGIGSLTLDNGAKVVIGNTTGTGRGRLWIGFGGNNAGTLNLLNGDIVIDVTSEINSLVIGRGDSADGASVGYATMSGGTITIDDSKVTGGAYGAFSIAEGTNSQGTFTQSGGTINGGRVNGVLNLGAAGGKGTYAMSGDASYSSEGGTIYIGNGTGGVGTLTLTDDASFSLTREAATGAGQFYLGSGGGTGTITQEENSSVVLVTDNQVRIGRSGGTGIYNLRGGTLSIGGHNGAAIGESGDGKGLFIQDGGVLTAVGNFYVGSNAAGSYTLNNGIAKFQDKLIIASGADSKGTVSLKGGEIRVGGTDGISAGAGEAELELGNTRLKVEGSNLTTSVDITLLSTTTATVDTNGKNATLAGTLSGDGSLQKDGSGTLTLEGSNTYSGTTHVSAGTLLLTSSGTTGSGDVTIAAGATLAGTGVIEGFATINGLLAAGNSPGTLTFQKGATLSSTSETVLDLDGAEAGEFDLLAVTDGEFTLGGALTLNITSIFDGLETITLFDLGNGATVNGDFASVHLTGVYGSGDFFLDGGIWTYLVNDGSIIFDSSTGSVVVDAIPEPGTWALLVGGAAAGLWMNRRRKPAA